VLGRFAAGAEIAVEVPAFRSCLIAASTRPLPETGVEGCDYEVVRETAGKPVILRLLGIPGSEAGIRLSSGGRKFRRAVLDGANAERLVAGKTVPVRFAGKKRASPWHVKIGDLEPSPVPADAEALYEATCFAADNNALEVRSVLRSGPSAVPQVNAAREAFFTKPMFVNRGIRDRNLFDGKTDTFFIARLAERSFRLDFGKPLRMDTIVLRIRDRQAADTSPDLDVFGKEASAEVSADLETWIPLAPTWGGKGTIAVLKTPADAPSATCASGTPAAPGRGRSLFQGQGSRPDGLEGVESLPGLFPEAGHRSLASCLRAGGDIAERLDRLGPQRDTWRRGGLGRAPHRRKACGRARPGGLFRQQHLGISQRRSRWEYHLLFSPPRIDGRKNRRDRRSHSPGRNERHKAGGLDDGHSSAAGNPGARPHRMSGIEGRGKEAG